MRNTFLLALIIFYRVTAFAQSDSTNQDLSLLYKCWTYSREEATQSSPDIYRPCTYKIFPASRFRDRLEFETNGKCSYLYLDPVDRHHMVPGKWKYDKLKQSIIIFDSSGDIVYNFKLISIDENMLKLERLK